MCFFNVGRSRIETVVEIRPCCFQVRIEQSSILIWQVTSACLVYVLFTDVKRTDVNKRHDVTTSRRHDVKTSRRHDVTASRRHGVTTCCIEDIENKLIRYCKIIEIITVRFN